MKRTIPSLSIWGIAAVIIGCMLPLPIAAGDGVCGTTTGDCCQSNGTPGCDNLSCCENVCAIDPFCCNTSWDGICIDEAEDLCSDLCVTTPACPGTGDCCASNGSPGCDDVSCCESICAIDPFCCDVSWDGICASEAGDLCTGLCVAGLDASMDVLPEDCPNDFNPGGKGVTPIALIGDTDFDVNNVDITSLQLRRSDGVGSSLSPLAGPPGPSPKIKDETGPFAGTPCDCAVSEADGIDDLVLKFGTQELAIMFDLGSVLPGDTVSLVLTGELLDGTPFAAEDCIVLVSPVDDELPD